MGHEGELEIEPARADEITERLEARLDDVALPARDLRPIFTAVRGAPQQLELEVVSVESPQKPRPHRNGSTPRRALGPRLALSPDEAAAVLGVSRDYFDEHVISELRIVRRGRRILVALAELARWLERNATRVTFGGKG